MKLEFINEIDEIAKEIKEFLDEVEHSSIESLEEALGSAYVSPPGGEESAAKARAGELDFFRQHRGKEVAPGQDPAARGMGVARTPEAGQIVMKDGAAYIIVDRENPKYPAARYIPQNEVPLLKAKDRTIDSVDAKSLKDRNQYYTTMMGKRVAWIPKGEGER